MWRKWLPALVIGVLVLIAFHQTLRMYFWQDDYAFMFRLQHLNESAGQFGKGIFGNGPYRFIYTPMVLFYPLFKIQPFWYLLTSIIFRLGSLFGVYLFVKELLGNRRSALVATAISGVSFVGSETMLRITNTYQTSLGLLLATLMGYYLLRYFHHNRLKDYLIGLILFTAAIEMAYVRSHGLVLIALTILVLKFFEQKRQWRDLALMLPFGAVFYGVYLATQADGDKITPYLQHLSLKPVAMLINLIGNTIVPDVTTQSIDRVIQLGAPVHKFFGDVAPSGVLVGAVSIMAITLLIKKLWRRNHIEARALLIALAWIIANLLLYHIRTPSTLFESTHRYFTYSAVGVAIIIAVIAELYQKTPKIFHSIVASVIVLNIGLNINYELHFVQRISSPARQFYLDLHREMPVIEKDAVIFFDVKDDPNLGFQFNNFFHVASMPESTAIAVHYGIDRYDFSLVDHFEELLMLIDQGKTSIDRVHTFFYDGTLHNTTDQVRAALSHGTDKQSLSGEMYYETPMVTQNGSQFGSNDGITINHLSATAAGPIELAIDANIALKMPDKFPFYDLTQSGLTKDATGAQIQQITQTLPADRGFALAYLASYRDFLEQSKVSAETTWQIYRPEYVLDHNPHSYWLADRNRWGELVEDRFSSVDLAQAKQLERMPFFGASSSDLGALRDFIMHDAQLAVTISTDRSQSPVTKIIQPIPDGTQRRYTILTIPGGTKIQTITLKPLNFPATMTIHGISIRQPSFQELKTSHFLDKPVEIR
ncbi:glycosyltransferase family 39 protein [Candidatus Berkelbacteria bacterium]|nr:glycosyltransferase family 39 protein [Candidatus Berkelbacteria bacterium]